MKSAKSYYTFFTGNEAPEIQVVSGLYSTGNETYLFANSGQENVIVLDGLDDGTGPLSYRLVDNSSNAEVSSPDNDGRVSVNVTVTNANPVNLT